MRLWGLVYDTCIETIPPTYLQETWEGQRGHMHSLKSTHERPQDAESAPIMGDHRLHILVIENEVVTEADAKV